MIEIPEDIMKISDNLAACSVGEGIGRDILSGNIARAILAERDRCAKIAESEKYNTDAQLSLPPQSAAAYAIYQAIRFR